MENTQKNYCPCNHYNKKFVKQTRNDISALNSLAMETASKHNKLVDQVVKDNASINLLAAGLMCVGVGCAGVMIFQLVDSSRIDKLQRSSDILEARNLELELELSRLRREIKRLESKQSDVTATIDIK